MSGKDFVENISCSDVANWFGKTGLAPLYKRFSRAVQVQRKIRHDQYQKSRDSTRIRRGLYGWCRQTTRQHYSSLCSLMCKYFFSSPSFVFFTLVRIISGAFAGSRKRTEEKWPFSKAVRMRSAERGDREQYDSYAVRSPKFSSPKAVIKRYLESKE